MDAMDAWVQFDQTDIGRETRQQNLHKYTQQINKTWTPILPVSRKILVGKYEIIRTQFPLRPSTARTIHRAQGDTLDDKLFRPHTSTYALCGIQPNQNIGKLIIYSTLIQKSV